MEGEEDVKVGSEVIKVESNVEEDVEVGSEVVMVESNVEEKSVMNDEPDKVKENESSEDVGVRVIESEMSVGVDKGNEVEGSIVMDGSENELEVNTVLNESVGRVIGVEASVKVGVNNVESPEVSDSVSNVPVLDGNASVIDGNVSVIVGSPVSVNVGDRLISKDVKEGCVNVGKSVGVSGRKVGRIPPSLVENGGIGPV